MFLKLGAKTFSIPRQNCFEAINRLFQDQGLLIRDHYLVSQGRVLSTVESLTPGATVTAHGRLLGGKGGYGAKLKNQGGKKVRPNDNMFSRDMLGRRIVYSTFQSDYTEFCKKKKEEDEKVAKERQSFKVLESTLKEGHSFMKLDRKYNEKMQETEARLDEAFAIGKKRYQQRQKEEEKVQSDKDEHTANKTEGQNNGASSDAQDPTGEPTKKVKPNQSSEGVPKLSNARNMLKSLFSK